MNVFSTDHPLTTQPSWFDAMEHPRLSYVCRVLVVALILCTVFAGFLGFAMMNGDSPDVPDPSWTDSIFAAVGFFMAFPVFFFVSEGVTFGMSESAFGLIGVAINSLCWACVLVAAYRLVERYFQRKRGFRNVSE